MNLPGLVPLHCPSSCSVFAMYWVGTLDLAPSVNECNQAHLQVVAGVEKGDESGEVSGVERTKSLKGGKQS